MNIDIEKLGYRWKGEYTEGSTYKKGDVVRVGSKTQVFVDGNQTKEDFAIGQQQFTAKNQVAIDSNSYPQGFEGMHLHSKTAGSGYGSEFRHGRERNGGRAVSLLVSNTHDAEYVKGYTVGAIMSDGSVRAWGDRQDSAMGFGTYDVNNMFPTKMTFPASFVYPAKRGWAFYRHLFVVDSNNVLYGTGNWWGGSPEGGTSSTETTTWRPISHDDNRAIQEEIVEIQGTYGYYGHLMFMARGVSGKVYVWGHQSYWAHGVSNNNNSNSPRLIEFTADHPMRQASPHSQNYMTCSMVDTEGKLWTAGHSSRNMLNFHTDSLGFQKFDPWGEENAKVRFISKHESDGHWATGTQYYFSGCITLEDGRAYIFGNGLGQVGYGSGPNGWSYSWDIEPRYPFHTGVQKLMATNGGYADAVAWMQDGTLEHRGYSISSPTGSNSTVWNAFNSNTSGYVGPDITNVADLRGSGGQYGSSWAIRTTDGRMLCWGKTNTGSTGTGRYANASGSTSDSNNTSFGWVKCPKKIIDFSQHGYCHADTGNINYHALAEDGSTWTWGWGSYGLQQDDDNENMGVPRRTFF